MSEILSLISKPELEYKDFVVSDFDPKQYANQILQALPDNPFHNVDVTTSLVKLSVSIEHLNSTIKQLVTDHYEDLILQVSSLNELERLVSEIKNGYTSLESEYQDAKNCIMEPLVDISRQTNQLEKTQELGEVLKRVHRALSLMKRLESLDFQEFTNVSSKAMDLCQLDKLLQDPHLSLISVIQERITFVDQVRQSVLDHALDLLNKGQREQHIESLVSAMQIYSNLDILVPRVSNILSEIVASISSIVKTNLDISSINAAAQELSGKENTGPVVRRNEPNSSDSMGSNAWKIIIWSKMETLIDEFYTASVVVYSLENTLEKMRNPVTQTSLLETIHNSIGSAIGSVFWKDVATVLDKEIRFAIKNSTFLQQTFQTEYPRLLRLFHVLMHRLAIASGYNGKDPMNTMSSQCILNVLSNFETSYLSRSLTRLLDPVNQSYPDKVMGPSRTAPKREDVDKILRVISGELEQSKFDSHLLKSVFKNIHKALGMYLVKGENLMATDSSVIVFGGLNTSSTASASQILNIEIINCIWYLKESFYNLSLDYTSSFIYEKMNFITQSINKHLTNMVEPLYTLVCRDVESIFLKMHKEDYGRSAPKQRSIKLNNDTSPFLIELVSKLKWLHKEILIKLNCGEESLSWNRSLGFRILDYFTRQASIIRPLSEAGKLKLAGEMTQLEFALSQWLNGFGIKLETDLELQSTYKTFRSFKPFIFLETHQLIEKQHNEHIPDIMILHHLFVRGFPHLSLPPWHFEWNEQQYSDWLDMNSEKDGIALIEKCLDIYAEEVKRRGEKEYIPIYPLIKSFISNCKNGMDQDLNKIG